MTIDAYNYYNLLKQNTEELGSIFDAQPSTLNGNIHCITNITLPVIGYVTAGTYAQKRIYINYSQLSRWITQYPYDCEVDTQRVNSALIPLPNPYIILGQAFNKQGADVGFLVSDPECADCTIRGTTVQPSFWINSPGN